MNQFIPLRLLLTLAFLMLAACVDTRDLNHAPASTQRLHVWHADSGEDVDVVYRDNGHYIQGAIDQLDNIFRDRHTGDVYPMDPALYDMIADLRDRMVMPADARIQVLSGYRSPESNAALARINKYVARHSYHMKGKAADIRMPDMDSRVLELVAQTIQRGGVALYPDRSRHVHVDVGPIRSWSVERGDEVGLRNVREKARAPVKLRPVLVEPQPAPHAEIHKDHVPLPPKVNFNKNKKLVPALKGKAVPAAKAGKAKQPPVPTKKGNTTKATPSLTKKPAKAAVKAPPVKAKAVVKPAVRNAKKPLKK